MKFLITWVFNCCQLLFIWIVLFAILFYFLDDTVVFDDDYIPPIINLHEDYIDYQLKDYQKFQKDMNKLTGRIFTEIITLNSKQNIVFSPSSIYYSLSKLYFNKSIYAGEEFQNAVGTKLCRRFMYPGFETLNSNLESSKHIELRNIQMDKKNLEKKVNDISFNSINRFIEESNEDIQNIISNSVEWKNSLFFNNNITLQQFTIESGKNITVPMMQKSSFFNYYFENDIHFIEIPFEDSKYSFIIYYPENWSDILNYTHLPSLHFNSFNFIPMDLTIPKFKIQSCINVQPFLEDFGIKKLFSETTNSKTEKKDISGLFHFAKLSIEVLGSNQITSNQNPENLVNLPNNILKLIINHPFLFSILNRTTLEYLFLGTIFNPQQ